MKAASFVSALALSFDLAIGAAVPPSHSLHEKRDLLSSRWLKKRRAPSRRKLPMRIGLAQSNLDRADAYLMEISDPASPKYGQTWTPQEVVEAFQPTDQAVTAVMKWLADHGGWLAFDAPVHVVESLLYTEYFEYHDSVSSGVLPACDAYHVPKSIQHHVDYITPSIKLVAPTTVAGNGKSTAGSEKRSSGSSARRPVRLTQRPQLSRPPLPNSSTDLDICEKEITPACLAALYKYPPGSKASPSNSLGIFEAELQFWDQEDLNLFFANFTPWIHNGTHPIDRNIDGGVAETTNLSAAGGEAMLDLVAAYPIIHPQSITVWNVDDLNYQAWENDTYTWGFNTLLDAIDGSYCSYSAYGETGDAPGLDPTYPDPMPGGYKGKVQCGLFRPTNVISLSYGGQEADVPIAYQKRQCLEYLKLGLQGVSFLFASGDAGVGDYPEPYGNNGPTGCLGPAGNIFNPSWPNTCPYVTNVGATKVYPGHSVLGPDPESAAYDPAGYPYHVNYSSGGGFSNVYPVPSYQKAAIATFFHDHDPPYSYYSALAPDAPNPALPDVVALAGDSGGIYNRIGRGVPDVAANGDNLAVYTGGEFGLSGGTSQSTPIFAAIINRLNEERLAIGKGPVGFLNPVLYANPQVLNDIINGTNPGCGTVGFSAVKGWDPVTGLGTPNYPKMLELFLALP